MPISSKKITAFAKKVADLADKPNSSGLTAAEVKAQFDAAPDELRGAFNGLIDLLLASTSGDSGAHNIGSDVIVGVTGSTVYDQLVSLKQALNNVALGDIPDGSITPVKLSETAKAAQNISITDTDAHFISDDVEGALSELFTFANDGKTQVASVVTAKGVAASPTDTFSTLATKIGQISTGKKSATGTFTSATTKQTINGLAFTPSIVYLCSNGANGSNREMAIFSNSFFYTFNTAAGLNNYKGAYLYAGVSSGNNEIPLTDTNYELLSNGFSFICHISNMPMHWIAFE